jgi:hypothetical protein
MSATSGVAVAGEAIAVEKEKDERNRVRCSVCGVAQFERPLCVRCHKPLPEPIVNVKVVEVEVKVPVVVELIREVLKVVEVDVSARRFFVGPDVPTLAEVEEELIRRAMKAKKGNIDEAAKMIGIGKTTIRRKLYQFGLNRKMFLAASMLLALLWCGHAQAQWTAVTASHLVDAAGGPLGTIALPGEVCVQIVDQNNHPMAASLGSGGGQIIERPGCGYVVNGTITTAVLGGGAFQVPDTSLTSPLHACERFTFVDGTGVPVTPPGYTCVQPSGTTFDLDSYAPSSIPLPVSTALVSSINSVTGNFTFTGSGVTCTGNHCVFNGGGGGTSSLPALSDNGTVVASTEKLVLPAASSAHASINLAPGTVAPSSPSSGDLWATNTGLYADINSAVVGPIGAGCLAQVNGVVDTSLTITGPGVSTAGNVITVSGAGSGGALSGTSLNISGGASFGGPVTSTAWPYSGIDTFGDSTCRGQYSANQGGDGNQGFPYWANLQVPGGVNYSQSTGNANTGYCQDGAYATDIDQFQLFPLGAWKYGTEPPSIYNTGLNDRRALTAAQQAIAQSAHLAFLYRRLIPAEFQILPPSGNITASSDFSLNLTRIGANAPTLESTTNGGTISFQITTVPLPSGLGSYPIVIWYEMQDGNAGAATVSVSGAGTVGTINSGNTNVTSGSGANCICTLQLGNTLSPQAFVYTPASAGTYTVTLTVTGATAGVGMGFSFIGVGTPGQVPAYTSTNPTPAPIPTIYEGGLLRVPGYAPGGIDDTIDGIWQSDISALQNMGLPVIYVCGLAGDYASFPGSSTSIQPQGCTDTTNWALDNNTPGISTTAWNGSQLTVVLTASAPTAWSKGNEVVIQGTAVKTSISNPNYWNIQSISGSTLTMVQPGFNPGSTWTATSDPLGVVEKDFYSNPHPNSHGYRKMWFEGYNRYIKAMGGGAKVTPAPYASYGITQPGLNASYTLLGTEGIVQMDSASTSVTTTLTLPNITNPGPFTILNYGSQPLAIATGSGAVNSGPSSLAAGATVILHNSNGHWWEDAISATGGAPATTLNLSKTTEFAPYTLVGTEGFVQMGSGATTLTLPASPVNVGPFAILNFASTPLTIAAGSGATLTTVPSTLASNAVMIIHAGSSGSWYLDSTSSPAVSALNLSKTSIGANYTLAGAEGILSIVSSPITITLPASPTSTGPFVILNATATADTIAAGSGASLVTVPTTLAGYTSITIHYGSGGGWYLDAISAPTGGTTTATKLALTQGAVSLPYMTTGTEGVIEANCTAGSTITLNDATAAAGPIRFLNYGSAPCIFALASGAAGTNVPAQIEPSGQWDAFVNASGHWWGYYATPLQGYATLSSGTVTVTTTAACTPSSSCNYKINNCGANGSTAIGVPTYSNSTAGTSFTINSLSSTNALVSGDSSHICWQIN